MFTGLIEEIGRVAAVSRAGDGLHLSIHAERVLEGTRIGDSICINGACQTVTALDSRSFTVFVSSVTASVTTLSFAANAQTSSIVDAWRNVDFDFSMLFRATTSVTLLAWILDDLTFTVTGGTGARHRKKALRTNNLPRTSTSLARRSSGAFLGTTSVAFIAGLLGVEFNCFFETRDDLMQINF